MREDVSNFVFMKIDWESIFSRFIEFTTENRTDICHSTSHNFTAIQAIKSLIEMRKSDDGIRC